MFLTLLCASNDHPNPHRWDRIKIYTAIGAFSYCSESVPRGNSARHTLHVRGHAHHAYWPLG
eukprot:1242623-Pyramimonas_sp.AAC.1